MCLFGWEKTTTNHKIVFLDLIVLHAFIKPNQNIVEHSRIKMIKKIILFAVLLTWAKGMQLDTVTALGNGLYHTLSKIIDGVEGDMSEEVGDRIREINMKIMCTQCSVIEEIGLPFRLKKLQDILTSTNFIYDYVKNILTAADEDSRRINEGYFLVAFRAHESDIDDLRYMLMSVDDGTTDILLNDVTETVGCSISILDRFSYVYTDIVSTGYALSLVNELLSDYDHAPDVKTEWVKSINKILDIFEKQRVSCILNFPLYAAEDFNTITNGKDLFTTLQSRYSDKLVDVMYLPRDCVIYHIIQDPFLFKQTNSTPVRIAVFSLKKTYENVFPTNAQIVTAERELIESGVCRMTHPAMHILDSVLNLFKWHSRHLRLLIAVPTNKISHDSFYTSDGSPIKISTFTLGECGKYTIVTYERDTTTNPSEASVIEVVTEADPGRKPASGTVVVENSLWSQILIVHFILMLFV